MSRDLRGKLRRSCRSCRIMRQAATITTSVPPRRAASLRSCARQAVNQERDPTAPRRLQLRTLKNKRRCIQKRMRAVHSAGALRATCDGGCFVYFCCSRVDSTFCDLHVSPDAPRISKRRDAFISAPHPFVFSCSAFVTAFGKREMEALDSLQAVIFLLFRVPEMTLGASSAQIVLK